MIILNVKGLLLLAAAGVQSLPAPPMITTSTTTTTTTAAAAVTTTPTTNDDSIDEKGFIIGQEDEGVVETSTDVTENELEDIIVSSEKTIVMIQSTVSDNDLGEVTTTKIDTKKTNNDDEESLMNFVETAETETTIEPFIESKQNFIDSNDITDYTSVQSLTSANEETDFPESKTRLKSTNQIKPTTYIPGAERRILIAYLGNIDLSHDDIDIESLKATPREKLAIAQELELQRQGLTPFSDPTPWQRLSKDQQQEFNRKYLALPHELRMFSRDQFLTLSDKMQAKAYTAFLTLDSDSLKNVLEQEMETIKRMEAQNTELFSKNIFEFVEKPRAQNGLKAPNFNFNQIEENSWRIKSKYDPRKRQFSQKQLKQRQRKKPGALDFMKTAEQLHFKYAQAQLQQAIKLQACLANRKYCE